MKRLKDFFYDKNDILIALAILVLAAALIIWRMEVIMAYPKTMAEKTGTVNTTEEKAVDSKSDQENGEDSDSSQGSSVWTNGVLSHEVTVTVQGGSATAAVQSLIDAGLFESYDQYAGVCKAAGYTPENIKATTFTFQAGSTDGHCKDSYTVMLRIQQSEFPPFRLSYGRSGAPVFTVH